MLTALILLCSGGVCAQSVSSSTNLSFGSFAAGTGGSVVVSPAGARNKTGGVVLSSQGATATAAQISVLGTASATITTISLPANGTVTLTDGTHTMALNNFVSLPTTPTALSGGGTLTISIGAELIVSPAQPPGNYTGSFNVTVNY